MISQILAAMMFAMDGLPAIWQDHSKSKSSSPTVSAVAGNDASAQVSGLASASSFRRNAERLGRHSVKAELLEANSLVLGFSTTDDCPAKGGKAAATFP